MWAWGAVIGLATLFDAYFTYHQIKLFVSGVELNPLVKYLSSRGDNIASVIFGVVVPSAGVLGLMVMFLPVLLPFYAGIKAHTTLQQVSYIGKANLARKLSENKG